MRIVPKLTIALFSASCLVMALDGWLRARREVHFLEAARARDHEMIGRSLAATVAETWRHEGREPALRSINAANLQFTQVQISWRESGALRCAGAEQALTTCVVPQGDTAIWFTYVPVEVDGARGAIELSERDTTGPEVVRDAIVDGVVTALAFALIGALLAYALGQWLVGRPAQALIEKARRIGEGDFTDPIPVRTDDELGRLAGAMNATCERLRDTLAQLRHADRLAHVGTLASGVAHELGTPLNVVSAHAQKIADAGGDEHQKSARAIAAASEKMTRIIRQLMQFARRGGAPQKAATDLRQIASDTLDLMRPIAAKSSVVLELEADGEATLDADPGQLQQVLTNLVMNAVQAMPKGGRVGVSIRAERAHPPGAPTESRACVCLRVSDEGVGIAPEDVDRVFEPFFTTKDVGEGTGLGLPVSYGIVRDHGGWITVESALGEGTTFAVYLPRDVEA